MPRAELTYVLEDPAQAGVLVDNAAAWVYLPGTTTEITLFAAADGVNELTQPIFSGPSQGEESGTFRAWLPEAMSIDLYITDNDDMAVEASPPFDPVSFTPFTEQFVVTGDGRSNTTSMTPTRIFDNAGSSSHTTSVNARRVQFVCPIDVNVLADRVTIDSVSVIHVPNEGVGRFVFGSLDAPGTLPAMTFKTNKTGTDAIIIEEF